MKLVPALALSLALGAASWTLGRSGEPPPVAEEPLFEADRAFAAATAARGLEGWLAWFVPDALVLTGDGSAVRGAEELRGYYAGLPGFPPEGFTWEPKTAGLASSGELGWTAGTYSTAEEKDAGRYLSVWRLSSAGEWRVLTDLGGERAYRTRLTRLGGPPEATTSEAVQVWMDGEGGFAVTTGTWSARREERTTGGRFLGVWERASDGGWEVRVEIGSEDS